MNRSDLLPLSFNITGRKINVRLDYKLNQRTDADGEYHSRFDEIIIQAATVGIERQDQQVGESFWHEVTHCILDTMEEQKLNENEKFVGLFGKLLYQVIKTLDYGELNHEK